MLLSRERARLFAVDSAIIGSASGAAEPEPKHRSLSLSLSLGTLLPVVPERMLRDFDSELRPSANVGPPPTNQGPYRSADLPYRSTLLTQCNKRAYKIDLRYDFPFRSGVLIGLWRTPDWAR